MGRELLSAALAEKIARSEVRRFGGQLLGFDTADLLQEARVAIHVAMRRCDGRKHGSKTYLRRAARNRLSNLLRNARAFGRCPHDAWGRPRPDLLSAPDDYPRAIGERLFGAASSDVERETDARREVAYLRERLDPQDWALLINAFTQGAKAARVSQKIKIEEVREEAARILRRLHYRVLRESKDSNMARTPTPEDPVECHADGDAPQGYDPADAECRLCPDKFSCLPRAVEKKLKPGPVSIDKEVEAVEAGLVTVDEMIARMKRRYGLVKVGENVPADLQHDYPGLTGGDVMPAAASGKLAVKAPLVAAAAGTVVAESAPAEKPAKKPAKAKTGHMRNGQSGPAKPAKKPAKKPAGPAKKPAKAKKAPAPKAEAKPKRVMEATAIVSEEGVQGVAYVVAIDGKAAFDIVETEEGWGWWSRRGSAESADWFQTYGDACADIAERVRPGGVVERASSARKPPKLKAPKGKPPKKAGAAKVGRPSPVSDSWPRMRDGRIYPQPFELTEEAMLKKIAEAQQKLGCSIELEIGYQIVRRLRGGEEVVVTLDPHGFRYTLPAHLAEQCGCKSRSQLFGSLSSIAQWADGRLRTGNEYFSIAKHACTEIRDEHSRIIDRRGGVPAWTE